MAPAPMVGGPAAEPKFSLASSGISEGSFDKTPVEEENGWYMDGICIHTYIYISYGGRKYIMISDI
jgi:hypothetical protein